MLFVWPKCKHDKQTATKKSISTVKLGFQQTVSQNVNKVNPQILSITLHISSHNFYCFELIWITKKRGKPLSAAVKVDGDGSGDSVILDLAMFGHQLNLIFSVLKFSKKKNERNAGFGCLSEPSHHPP